MINQIQVILICTCIKVFYGDCKGVCASVSVTRIGTVAKELGFLSIGRCQKRSTQSTVGTSGSGQGDIDSIFTVAVDISCIINSNIRGRSSIGSLYVSVSVLYYRADGYSTRAVICCAVNSA